MYKNVYGGLSSSTWLLTLIMFINRSGTMVLPFMTLYLTSNKMGFNLAQAGYVFALFGLGAFIGAWFGGRLTDKVGFYIIQFITLFSGGILFIILGQMHQYSLICVFTFLLSFVNEAFRPANSTAIAFYSTVENRVRSYSLNRLAINLGWAFGGVIGGILAKYNYQLLFWVDGITNILAALLLWVLLKPKKVIPIKIQDSNINITNAFRDKKYMFFIVCVGLFASCFFQLFTNLPVFFRNYWRLEEPYIGVLMAINGLLIVFFEMAIIYTLSKKNQTLLYIVVGTFICGISFLILLLPLSGKIMALLVIVLISFGEMFCMPFMNTYMTMRSHENNRGQYAALYTMAWSTAQCLGPMLGSQIAIHYGFNYLWAIAAVVLFLTTYLFWKIYLKEKL